MKWFGHQRSDVSDYIIQTAATCWSEELFPLTQEQNVQYVLVGWWLPFLQWFGVSQAFPSAAFIFEYFVVPYYKM